jgi:hypothetical protein
MTLWREVPVMTSSREVGVMTPWKAVPETTLLQGAEVPTRLFKILVN